MNNKLLRYGTYLLFAALILLPFAAGILHALLYVSGTNMPGPDTGSPVNIFSTEVLTSLVYSLAIATLSIATSFSIAAALVLFYKDRLVTGRRGTILYFPLAIPAIVAAFISFGLLGKTGIFSALAFGFGFIHEIRSFPDLINDRFGIGIMLTHILMATPFFTIFCSQLYRTANIAALESTAYSLGASYRVTATRIVLPVLMSRSLPNILLYGIFVLGSYEIPLILGAQSPQMISVLIVRKLQRFNLHDIPQGYANALLLTFIVILILSAATLFTKNKGQ